MTETERAIAIIEARLPLYTDIGQINALRECISSIRSAALSAGQAQPVAIKPLEWSETSYGTPEVYSVVGVYRINHAHNGGWSLIFKTELIPDEDGRENFATIEKAKAAAQKDYETRILSALEVSHAS